MLYDFKNDDYIKELLSYLSIDNRYDELINNIYVCKKINSFNYLLGIFHFDYMISYDKYVKIGDSMILLSVDNREFCYDFYKRDDIIESKIEEIEFRALLYTNDEVLKSLLDLFDIENDIVITKKEFGPVSMKSLMKG